MNEKENTFYPGYQPLSVNENILQEMIENLPRLWLIMTYIIDLTTAIYELENSNYMIGGENVIEIISNSGLILKGTVLKGVKFFNLRLS